MKKAVLMMAAAGSLLVGGAIMANAQTSLSNGFRGEYDAWPSDRTYSPNGDYYAPEAHAELTSPCGFVTIRERHGDKIVVRAVPRC